ncbi:Hypotetical protein [Plasmodium sp. gorilla clade G2]|uniref:Hypotetical protein n=1 Tax=Plasmodium sp. gorilla clade G2 TaxID=880535 RepID=UPI000D222E66|nr:Hypotetical protein [Plasmodium sp. gorilla clade G2]SOV13890.1 Hypotetical protein [Plasmodium sp. gorilla clade G2]
MLFLSFKIFIFVLVLNIILGSNKNNNVINIFEKIKNKKQFHIRINKSLAEYIKNESRNYESIEFDLLYEELVEQKLKNYQRLMDLRKKEKNYEKRKRRDKKFQDKVVRNKLKAYYVLIGDYNKYYEISDSFNLFERKNKIKDKLYEMNDLFNLSERKHKIKNKLYKNIFKGTSFWKNLGLFLEFLGICAAESMIFVIFNSLVLILKITSDTMFSCLTSVIVPLGIYGVSILLIIITVIVVVLLVVWLWPKEEKNLINKMTEPI